MVLTFSNQDIADYYDQTEVHYRYFWDLGHSKALHYGFWTPGTRNFRESLDNTNLEMAALAGIKEEMHVFDAGCGIGGSSVFLARTFGCTVKGITLSARQVSNAIDNAIKAGVSEIVSFYQRDYCKTGFDDESFDCIWALESVGSAKDKSDFLAEAFRLLRPGGKLVMADYFKTFEQPVGEVRLMKDWLNAWAISDVENISGFESMLLQSGFHGIEKHDRTKAITPSSKRMYYASWIGMLGTKVYNLFRKASPFSRIHYRAGIAQYRALKNGLWRYHVIVAQKP